MAKPAKQWQLLLVADDGRIIPFKRIKGIVITLAILLVLVGLACAGLGWQLTALKVRHRSTLDQLADASRQVAHHKSAHELIAAELVLAEARMEKAGLLVAQPRARDTQPKTVQTAAAASAPDRALDGSEKKPASTAMAIPTAAELPSIPAAATPVARETVSETAPAEVAANPEQPAVELGALEMEHDTGNQTLLARFRVNNTGPRSSPVAGRCVVVLKNDPLNPETWLAMPEVSLVHGKPDGVQGQAFKISRFRDMEIKAMGQKDPSSYKTATVYVFDNSGAKILEKEFSIALPAPKPEPKPAPTPAVPPPAEPPTIDTSAEPINSPPTQMPVDHQTPVEDAREATGNRSMADPSDADAGTATQPAPTHAPADAPSPQKTIDPVKKEDSRSRF